jgi:hypothetical protein
LHSAFWPGLARYSMHYWKRNRAVFSGNASCIALRLANFGGPQLASRIFSPPVLTRHGGSAPGVAGGGREDGGSLAHCGTTWSTAGIEGEPMEVRRGNFTFTLCKVTDSQPTKHELASTSLSIPVNQTTTYCIAEARLRLVWLRS